MADSLTSDPALSRALVAAKLVREAGGRALIVGGWVRDRLLGHPSKDIDLEVYGLPAEPLRRVLELMGPVNTVGEAFTVFKVAELDVALPRRESKVARGHRGFEVTGDPFLSVDEATRRRDFTINAIAWDPLDDVYLDPFGGRSDLERRILRIVDPGTFGDDSL
ncbi:MAG: cca, partial [Acidobacteria bacterium]|nr:cca [Acidobacteriota bacterium]